MERLKILVSAYAFSPNAETATDFDRGILGWNLVDRLRRFYDIWVVTHNGNSEAILDALSAGALPRVNIHFVNRSKCWRFFYKNAMGRWLCQFYWQRKAWKYVRHLHAKIDFNAFHHLTPEFDWIPSFIGAYLPVPFIWGPLGGGENQPLGFDSGNSVLSRLKNTWHLLRLWLWRRHPARNEGEKKAKAILFCNQETRMRFSKAETRKLHYFPLTGISSDNLQENLRKKPRDRRIFRIISAGALEKKNGFSLAIEAFALFLEKFPESDFVIFGDGPEKRTLERKIEDLKLETRVSIHPWIADEALYERMQDSHVFMSTSLQDRAGFFVIRAMSAGLPVVCLDTGGPGLLVQEEWGIRIKPENPDQCARDLSNALGDLCENRAERRKMSLAALKNIKQHYTWNALGKALKRIYGEVLLQEEDVRFSKRGEERFFY